MYRWGILKSCKLEELFCEEYLLPGIIDCFFFRRAVSWTARRKHVCCSIQMCRYWRIYKCFLHFEDFEEDLLTDLLWFLPEEMLICDRSGRQQLITGLRFLHCYAKKIAILWEDGFYCENCYFLQRFLRYTYKPFFCFSRGLLFYSKKTRYYLLL